MYIAYIYVLLMYNFDKFKRPWYRVSYYIRHFSS